MSNKDRLESECTEEYPRTCKGDCKECNCPYYCEEALSDLGVE